MYARGMSTREIQGHREEIYKAEVSPTLISNVTEAVTEEVKNWQSRGVDSVMSMTACREPESWRHSSFDSRS